MKRRLLAPLVASTAIALLILSCKKENPTKPVNKSTEDLPCSFCFGESLELNDSLIASTNYLHQTTFWKNGQETGPNQVNRITPLGVYGYMGGVSLVFNSANTLSCTSNKVTFVHARVTSNTNNIPALVNVQFPGTPIISTIPDSLQYYLTPYGYTVEKYFQPGIVWLSDLPGSTSTGVVDSIIIRGPEFEVVTIGADLFESELRSICVAHE